MKSEPLSSLTVFVPAYNEEANISLIIEDVLKYVPALAKKWELIIVNDGSTDQTARIVRTYSERHAQVKLVNHAHNRGYGAAVKTGLRSARYDWIFFTDSDRQFSLTDMPKLFELADTSTMVIGYRYSRQDNLMRILNAKLFNLVVRILFGLKVKDIDCAFKLFERNIVKGNTLNSQGALINAELLIKAKRMGYQILEVAVEHRARVEGNATGANIFVILRAVRELFAFRIAVYPKLK